MMNENVAIATNDKLENVRAYMAFQNNVAFVAKAFFETKEAHYPRFA